MFDTLPEERKEPRRLLEVRVDLLISRLAVGEGPAFVAGWVLDVSGLGMRVALPSVEQGMSTFFDEFASQQIVRIVCKLTDEQGVFRVSGRLIYSKPGTPEWPKGYIVGISFDDADNFLRRRLSALA